MIKYITRWDKIEKIEIECETETQVVLMGGERSNKISDYECYFDTWADAKQCLLDRAQRAVLGIRRSLEVANGTLGNIKGMKNPDKINTK